MKNSKFRRENLPSGAAYFESIGQPLRGSGAWRVALCPAHDDTTPSLRVKADTGAFRCFVCGFHGSNVLDIEMKRTGLGFKESAKQLGAWIENS